MRETDLSRRLDDDSLRLAVAELSRRDDELRRITRLHGTPPLWARDRGFATLIRIILEQQVSLASGAAVYKRVEQEVEVVTAPAILEVGDGRLRGIGVTRQKASYCVAAAQAQISGLLDFDRISEAPVDAAQAELMQVKGVGRWTSDVYLLMAERRPDIWPVGDIALQTAMQHMRGLDARPNAEEAAKEAIGWAPWRAVAARILWHGYLSGSLRGSASHRSPDNQRG